MNLTYMIIPVFKYSRDLPEGTKCAATVRSDVELRVKSEDASSPWGLAARAFAAAIERTS